MDLQSLVQYKKSKRRERAARMAEEPVSLLDDLDSAEEDTDLLKLKPQRPPRPKKVKDIEERLKDPLYEEDIVEGFSFCSFVTYEDLDVSFSEKANSSDDSKAEYSVYLTPMMNDKWTTAL